MNDSRRESRRQRLSELRSQVDELEREMLREEQAGHWPPEGYYTAYHALAGFVLGIFGAMASLVFNIVGSLLAGMHPLRLIQVYLTFPLGETALTTEGGLALAVGTCLYLATGMMLGIPFHLVLSRYTDGRSFAMRLGVVSALATALWAINFYVLLSWLQPLLFGGNWIVQLIPWWVGLLTHLVFGWTMLAVYPLGKFVPYRSQTERTS